MRPKTKLLLIIGVVIALTIILGVATNSKRIGKLSHGTGTVTLSLQLSNTDNVVAEINSKQYIVTGLHDTYTVPSGQETLTVTKPGYTQFTTSFHLATDQTVVINVAPQSTAPKATPAATTQVQASLSSILPAGFTIQSANYFYDNTWVVAVISNSGDDTAVVVAQYIDSTATKWTTELGPGTIFPASQTVALPTDVNAYLSSQGYIFQGSLE
jgi:hypothetical protein